jgi:predicted transcriptional regulator
MVLIHEGFARSFPCAGGYGPAPRRAPVLRKHVRDNRRFAVVEPCADGTVFFGWSITDSAVVGFAKSKMICARLPTPDDRCRWLMWHKCATLGFAHKVQEGCAVSTTTIRMEDALKARIAAAAERAGKSSHAFILDALSETVERIETDDELHRIADERWVALRRTGKSVAWTDAKEYLQARASGKKARRPSARQPSR